MRWDDNEDFALANVLLRRDHVDCYRFPVTAAVLEPPGIVA